MRLGIRYDRAHLFAAISEQAAAEGRAARESVRRAQEREYGIRQKGACALCRDDVPSATYRWRRWCRACGRIWSP